MARLATPQGRRHGAWCAILAVLLCLPVLAHADVANPNGSIALGHAYNVLADPTGTLTYADVTGDDAARFQPLERGDEPNLGYSSAAYWLRARVETPAGSPERHWVLEVPFPTLDDVTLHLRSLRTGALLATYRTGDLRPFAERPVHDTNFVFPLPLEPSESYEIYLRVQSQGSLTVSSYLWAEPAYNAHSRDHYILASVYLGLLAGLLTYNLLLFFSLRDRVYLLYVLFGLAMALGQGAWNGYFFEYLWPGSPRWGNLAAVVGFNATGLFGALFSRAFLNTREHAPRLDAVILVCAGIFAVLVLTAPLLPYRLHAMLTSITGLAFPPVAVAGGALCLVRGIVSARYFLLAWTLLLAGTAMLGARNLGLIPTNFFTLYSMQVGSALEVLLLSFALAERIHEERSQKDAAEAANRAKDDFLATVSHEIRTPLTVLLGNVSLLLSSRLQPQQAVLARGAKRSGEQLLSMLNDLIDLSRAASGQLCLEKTPFNVGALMRETVELVETPAREKGLAIQARVGFHRLHLLGDARRIRQVLLNLVFNAIKFTERGEIRLEAALLERVAGRVTVRFSVTDTGIGINPADQARLFRPFAQVDNAQARLGSGLGLAISRRLVEEMGGTIRIFSRPGQGSRFWFDLDLLTVSEAETAAQEEERGLPLLHLLLVDDVYESREVLAAQLAHAGHVVTAASSGQAAIEAMERQRFDAVLMDLNMPEMDGYETVRYLHARPEGCNTPIFALTADATTRTAAACKEAGMRGIIGKPLRMEEFNATLRAHFGAAAEPRSAPVADAEPDLVDEALLEDRLGLLGASGLTKVIHAFLSVADQRLTAVLDSARQQDTGALARAAHALRGSAGAVGLPALMELAGTIEEAAKEEDPVLGQLVAHLPEVMQNSRAALEAWCNINSIAA